MRLSRAEILIKGNIQVLELAIVGVEEMGDQHPSPESFSLRQQELVRLAPSLQLSLIFFLEKHLKKESFLFCFF